MSDRRPSRVTRRDFLRLGTVAALAAACGTEGTQPTTEPAPTATGPTTTFQEPSTALSGELSILLWSHFVPRHDDWFDPFAEEWGEQVGVDVTVDHISVPDVPARIQSEITAGAGHDLIQYIAPLPQFEQSVVDLTDLTEEAVRRHGEQLELCRKSSFNPTTGKFYAYAPGWVPDPGDFRRSLWTAVDLPDGPSTWAELREGGARIHQEEGVPLGLGMSHEIDSNMAARALVWSFGGAVQDERENVVLNSPQTIEAVDFMAGLFEEAMTDEVFAWNPSSNNQGLIAGQLSYILNSISAWRTAQDKRPDVAADVYFVPALEGPAEALVAQHVMYNWIVPSHSDNVGNAKEFLLHYTANFASATFESKLYDLPAFGETVPQLDGWLADDPFALPDDDPAKLEVLRDAVDWSTNVGHRGPASAAIGAVFAEFVLPDMLARAARGDQTPQESVAQAERQTVALFDQWRERGLVGGGRG